MIKAIVTDIFGITPALEELAGAVVSVTAIIDPYSGKEMNFGAESLAYEYFMIHGQNPLMQTAGVSPSE
jgi:hypothetical protein